MEKYVNNAGQELVVLGMVGRKATIQFTETGSVRTANIDNVRAGKVRDFYAKSCYGIGYQGEFNKVGYWKQAKQLWQNMMKKCYSDNDDRGYKNKGVIVSPRWHCFANFLNDLPSLPNFDKWLLGQRTGYEKYNLDKDMRVPGCNVYSKETCQFLSESENKSLVKKNKTLVIINGVKEWVLSNEQHLT